MTTKETFYHVTVLSNFARGFDKYSRGYSKARIPESTYPDRFFLLRRGELGIGIQKASHLLEKLGLAGNRLIVLETELDAELLQTNTANGRGQFIRSNKITLSRLYEIEHDENVVIQLRPVAVEDVMAASLRLLNREFLPFVDIRPRAISFLPVALACHITCRQMKQPRALRPPHKLQDVDRRIRICRQRIPQIRIEVRQPRTIHNQIKIPLQPPRHLPIEPQPRLRNVALHYFHFLPQIISKPHPIHDTLTTPLSGLHPQGRDHGGSVSQPGGIPIALMRSWVLRSLIVRCKWGRDERSVERN